MHVPCMLGVLEGGGGSLEQELLWRGMRKGGDRRKGGRPFGAQESDEESKEGTKGKESMNGEWSGGNE